jgi:hypothetical protein
VSPPSCLACGHPFRDRESRHLHAPGRCPEFAASASATPRSACSPVDLGTFLKARKANEQERPHVAASWRFGARMRRRGFGGG